MKKASSFTLPIYALLLALLANFSCASAKVAHQGPQHPGYLHALSDLRAARWMLEHRPGNWKQEENEVRAVAQIDVAINEIKKASIDDGKDLNNHPPVDERPDHRGRLHAALDLLRKAHEDINREEDNPAARDLRNRSFGHIDDAIHAVERAIAANPS